MPPLRPHKLRENIWKRLKAAGSAVRYYLVGLYYRADEDHVFLSAGGLAFSLFVCIVPFVLIIFSVLGMVLETSSVREEIASYIERFIPYEPYASFVESIISTRIEEFRIYRSVAGYVGVVGLLFAASTLFSSIRTILNKAYRVGIDKPVVVAKLRDFGMVLLVLAFFIVSITSLPILEIIKDSAHRFRLFEVFRFTGLESLFFTVVSLLVVFFFFIALYSVVPYERPGRRVTLCSAFIATILWEIAKQAFGYYITNVATLKRVYGTYVLIVVVAFWIYYSSVAFILGAVIGQLYRERREKVTAARASSADML